MNESQYRCLRANRRVRGAQALGVCPREGQVPAPAAAVVAAAARAQRRRMQAAAAWQRIIPPGWREETEVVAVEADAVVVAVGAATLLYELRRRQPALERELTRLAPGSGRLRFIAAGGPGATR